MPGRVAQSVTCLATDTRLTADSGVTSLIQARSHTFMEIDHEIFLRSSSSLPLNHSRRVEIDYEIISWVILFPSAESFKKVVSYKQKYVHEVLVNCLFKLAQEKMWLGELTVPP